MKLLLSVLAMVIGQSAWAQNNYPTVQETWSGIGVAMSQLGTLTGVEACNEHYNFGQWKSIEFPIGSGVQFSSGSWWFGAEIMAGGVGHPRVSIGTDGWMNPSINELHPDYGNSPGIVELAHRDTSYWSHLCLIEPLFDPYGRADHVFEVTLFDTLTDRTFVRNDHFDGPHVPLGLEVEMSSYAFLNFCRRVIWFRLRVTNIGPNTLRNLWCGYHALAEVSHIDYDFREIHGGVGFEHDEEFGYFYSLTGQADSSEGEFFSTAAAGVMPLINRAYQSVSFNWWQVNFSADPGLQFGPAWESYALRDSLGMGWTDTHGDPRGDRQRYQLMTNREQDFDPVRAFDTEWIDARTPADQRWAFPNVDPVTYRDFLDIPPFCLISSGPHGRQVADQYWLMPGDSVDIWFAVFGGQGFHNPNHPQPEDSIDADLYSLTDLLDRADVAKNSPCFAWLDLEDRDNLGVAAEFELLPPYPNPFNGEVRIEFVAPASQDVRVDVVNVLGQRLDVLFDGQTNGGSVTLNWSPQQSATGIYFARLLDGENVVRTRKLLYVK